MKSFITILFFVVVASCSSTPKDTANLGVLSDSETLSYRNCSVDSNCVYTTNGCCDCANGGEDIAVNKDKLNDFNALFSCSGACTMIGAVPPCGSGTVSCQSGLCVYTKATE